MAGKISELGAATSVTDADQLEVLQSGVNKRGTLGIFKTWIQSWITKAMVGLGNVPNTDATDRANHTGTQTASTISDFNTAALTAAPAETAGSVGTLINGAGAATPNDTDLVATAESSVLKKITWTNVKAFLKTYFDTLYHIVGGTDVPITDGGTGASTAAGAKTNLGVTSMVIIPWSDTAFNPVDSTIYYIGNSCATPATNAGTRRMYVRKACTITGATVSAFCTVNASNQTVTLIIRVNNTTDHLITNSATWDAGAGAYNVASNNALSIALADGDYYEVKIETPTWTTNPTGVLVSASIQIT